MHTRIKTTSDIPDTSHFENEQHNYLKTIIQIHYKLFLCLLSCSILDSRYIQWGRDSLLLLGKIKKIIIENL